MENKNDLCGISVVQRDGWRKVAIMVDSGASDSVTNSGMFPETRVLPTDASISGQAFTCIIKVPVRVCVCSCACVNVCMCQCEHVNVRMCMHVMMVRVRRNESKDSA